MIIAILYALNVICVLYLCIYIAGYFTKRNSEAAGQNKKLSIIIPFRNEGKRILKCLKSIKKQKGVKISKVVLVDDNSSDNYKKILRAKIKNFSFPIKIVHKTDGVGSIADSIKLGCRYVKTKIVAVVTADVILTRNALRECIKYVGRNRAVSCIVDPLPGKGLMHKVSSIDKIFRQRFLQKSRSNLNLTPNLVGAFYLIHKDKIKQMKKSFVEDLLLTYKLYSMKNTIYIVPKRLAYEEEKNSLLTIINQKIRYSMGNIGGLVKGIDAIIRSPEISWSIGLFSYQILWYLLPLVVVFDIIALLFTSKVLYLFLLIFSMWQITIFLALSDYKRYCIADIPNQIVYSILYPPVMLISIFLSLIFIVRNGGTFFETVKLYSR